MSWRNMLTRSIWPYSTVAIFVLNSRQLNMLWSNIRLLSIRTRTCSMVVIIVLKIYIFCPFQWLWKLQKRSKLWMSKYGRRLKWILSPETGLVASVATVITGRKLCTNMLTQSIWIWFTVVITATSLHQLNMPWKSTWEPITKILLSSLHTQRINGWIYSLLSEINQYWSIKCICFFFTQPLFSPACRSQSDMHSSPGPCALTTCYVGEGVEANLRTLLHWKGTNRFAPMPLWGYLKI